LASAIGQILANKLKDNRCILELILLVRVEVVEAVYGLDGWGSFRGRGKRMFFTPQRHIGYGIHPASNLMGTVGSYLGVKGPERGGDRLAKSSALMALCFIN
jgi:hypothetical protein